MQKLKATFYIDTDVLRRVDEACSSAGKIKSVFVEDALRKAVGAGKRKPKKSRAAAKAKFIKNAY